MILRSGPFCGRAVLEGEALPASTGKSNRSEFWYGRRGEEDGVASGEGSESWKTGRGTQERRPGR